MRRDTGTVIPVTKEAEQWCSDVTTGSTLPARSTGRPATSRSGRSSRRRSAAAPGCRTTRGATGTRPTARPTASTSRTSGRRTPPCSACARRSSKPRLFDDLDPGWVQLVKFHNGAVALAEYAGAVAELRMARFGRDSAWRTMATLGALDEIRHTQIPLLIGHDLLPHDGNFDWTHKAYHTNEWVMIAARHLFDDMFLAADAIDLAIQLNFVFETGFTNLQFMAMAAHGRRRRPSPVREDAGEHPDRRGTPRADRPSGAADAARERLARAGAVPRRQDVVALLAAVPRADRHRDGVPHPARARGPARSRSSWTSGSTEQFMKNLAEFDLEPPVVLGPVHRRARLRAPQLPARPVHLPHDAVVRRRHARRAPSASGWTRSTPGGARPSGRSGTSSSDGGRRGGEAGTLAYALPALCNLCQLPTLFIRPGRNTACTLEMGGRRYLFCSEPCRWIFEQEKSRFADHKSVVDRIVAGEAPGKLTDLHTWMGLQAPVETGKDLRRGLDPWRLDPVPKR